MGTTRDSTQYTSVEVNKYVADARDKGGRAVPIPFTHTVVSGEVGGASAGVQDIANLCVLPANCEVVGLECITDGLSISGGLGLTVEIGDSGDSNRYMVATDFDVAEARGTLAFAGMRYRPTADTIVFATYKAATAPEVGNIFKGNIFIVPGA